MKISKRKRLKFYKSKEWRKKRQDILERDNNECQRCKRKGRASPGQVYKLDVHHIKHLEDRWDLKLDSNNLITLCGACHNLQHPEKLKEEHKGIHAERFE